MSWFSEATDWVGETVSDITGINELGPIVTGGVRGLVLGGPVGAGLGATAGGIGVLGEGAGFENVKARGGSFPAAPRFVAPNLGPVYTAQAEAAKFANKIGLRQLGMSERQAEIGEETYQRWTESYKPVEEKVVAEARKGVDPAVYEAAARNVAIQQRESLAGQRRRQRGMRGMDPSSPASQLQDLRLRTGIGKEAARVKTAERERIAAVNRSGLLNIVASGQQIPQQASGGYAGAAQAAGAAGAISQGASNIYSGALQTQAQAGAATANAMAGAAYQRSMAEYQYNMNMDWLNQQKQLADSGGGMFDTIGDFFSDIGDIFG